MKRIKKLLLTMMLLGITSVIVGCSGTSSSTAPDDREIENVEQIQDENETEEIINPTEPVDFDLGNLTPPTL